jgi:hypothetical protein
MAKKHLKKTMKTRKKHVEEEGEIIKGERRRESSSLRVGVFFFDNYSIS